MNFFCSNLAAMLLKARACSLSVQTWFFSVVFFGISSTLIDAHTLPGQTEGLKGGFKEWVDGWVAKVDNSFGYDKWTYYSRPLLMKKKKRRKFAS